MGWRLESCAWAVAHLARAVYSAFCKQELCLYSWRQAALFYSLTERRTKKVDHGRRQERAALQGTPRPRPLLRQAQGVAAVRAGCDRMGSTPKRAKKLRSQNLRRTRGVDVGEGPQSPQICPSFFSLSGGQESRSVAVCQPRLHAWQTLALMPSVISPSDHALQSAARRGSGHTGPLGCVWGALYLYCFFVQRPPVFL